MPGDVFRETFQQAARRALRLQSLRALATLCIAILAGCLPARADFASLPSVQDSYIALKTATTNFGTANSMIVDRETTDLQRALVQFDLTTVPAGSTVTSAVLKLQATQVGGSITIGVYRLLEPWTEGGATWDQRSSGTNWATPGSSYNSTAVASITTNSTGQHSFTVTSLVQSWVNGSAANYGFMVGSPDGGGNRTVTYTAREGTPGPILEITYTPPSNPSFTISNTVNQANISTLTTLSYTVTVANSGNVSLTSPVLAVALSRDIVPLALTSGPAGPSGDTNANAILDVGETWTYTASYAVTQADMDNGTSIINAATFDTAQTSPGSSNATTSLVKNPSLVVVKAASAPGGGLGVKVGDVVTYTFAVSNSGNVTITNVSVSDVHNGYGTPPVPGNESLATDVGTAGDSIDAVPNDSIWSVLAPGDTVMFQAAYTVVQLDQDYLN